jgi:hypothetical protein
MEIILLIYLIHVFVFQGSLVVGLAGYSDEIAVNGTYLHRTCYCLSNKSINDVVSSIRRLFVRTFPVHSCACACVLARYTCVHSLIFFTDSLQIVGKIYYESP